MRPATFDDLQAVADFIAAYDRSLNNASGYDAEALAADWQEIDLSRDSWLMTSTAGQPIGFAQVRPYNSERTYFDLVVYPPSESVGAVLLDAVEKRVENTAFTQLAASDQMTVALLEKRRYQANLHEFHMQITLENPPAAPLWENGIRLQPFIVGQDEYRMYELMQAAFKDTWSFQHRSFEEWGKRYERPDFDPTLYFFAVEGDQTVGGLIGRPKPDQGWVQGLGILPAWRKKGVGMALLLHAFGVFYGRGVTTIGLTVDSQSKTGATRLYERAGMRQREIYSQYEKK